MALRPMLALALLLAPQVQAQMVDELRHQAQTGTDPHVFHQTAGELQVRGQNSLQ